MRRMDVNAFPVSGALPGMSLRDYFAAKAMQALLQGDAHIEGEGEEVLEHVARFSYMVADSMMKARDAE